MSLKPLPSDPTRPDPRMDPTRGQLWPFIAGAGAQQRPTGQRQCRDLTRIDAVLITLLNAFILGKVFYCFRNNYKNSVLVIADIVCCVAFFLVTHLKLTDNAAW